MTSSSSVQLISDVNLDLRASISEFLSCRIFSSLMACNNKTWMNNQIKEIFDRKQRLDVWTFKHGHLYFVECVRTIQSNVNKHSQSKMFTDMVFQLH